MKKKILVALLLCFTLIIGGCSNNNKQYEEEALKAYVANANKLSEKDKIKMGMEGNITVPKTVGTKEETSVSVKGNMNYDIKNLMMEGDFYFKQNKEELEIKLAMDKNYIYFNVDGQWYKSKMNLDKDDYKNFTNIKKDMSLEEAKEYFSKFKEVSYTKETKDGVEGYSIKFKVNTEDIVNMIKDEGKASDEMLESLKNLEGEFAMFVPSEPTGKQSIEMKIGVEILIAKISVGPVKINIEPFDGKISIPDKAKKASEIDSDGNTMVPGMGV